MRGQPKAQYYFHRPLSEILDLCFQNGFYMNGMREPSLEKGESEGLFDKVFSNNPAAVICSFILKK
jgi:hypothetical protein